MRLTDVFTTPLTADQLNVAHALEAFLAGEAHCFVLSGYAGTGKTHLVGGLVRYLRAQNRDHRLLAPTGRAALILSDKTEASAMTMHRALYNLEELEDDDENYRIRFGRKTADDATDAVYIVDEASMVGDTPGENEFMVFGSGRLLKDLVDHVAPWHNRRRIIFIGDQAQLPPVQDKHSPALDPGYLATTYGLTCEQGLLTEVMRQQAGSGILDLATLIREDLRTGRLNRFTPDFGAEDVIDEPFEQAAANYAATYEAADPGRSVLLAHSNKQALAHNLAIRSILFPGRTAPGTDERLLIIRNNYNHHVDLYNGQFAQVLQASDLPEQRKVRMKLKGGRTAEVDLLFRDVTIAVSGVDGRRHQLECKVLENGLDKAEAASEGLIQQALFVDLKQRHPSLKPKSDAFRSALMNDRYFNALQVKYGYAITVHKAQGGEWGHVHLDLRTHLPVLSQGFLKLCYTGITRAKQRLFLIGADIKTPISDIQYLPIKKIARALPDQHQAHNTADDRPCPIPFPNAFQRARYHTIMARAMERNWTVSVTPLQYMDRYRFSTNGDSIELDLYYNAKDYTGKVGVKHASSPQFELDVKEILGPDMGAPLIHIPASEARAELYHFMEEVVLEQNTVITNIVDFPFQQRYFIQTGAACAGIDFHYDKHERFTKAEPFSTDGPGDAVLSEILMQLQ